jgi:hypothetical protein
VARLMPGILPAAMPMEPTVSHTPITFTFTGWEYLSSLCQLAGVSGRFHLLQRPDAFLVSLLVTIKEFGHANGEPAFRMPSMAIKLARLLAVNAPRLKPKIKISSPSL